MRDIYKNALAEVNAVINNSQEDIINKIPSRFKNFISQNMNSSHIVKIQSNKAILEQDISNEAKSIIALIYRDYICEESERKELIKQEFIKRAKDEQIKREKYIIRWNN